MRIWLLDESAAESASISPLSPALANGRTRGRAGVAAGHCVGGASSSGGASARERERRETVDGARDGPSRGSARLRLLCAKEEAHGGDYVSAVGYAHTGQTLATLSVFAQLKLWAVVRQYRRSGRGEAGSGRDGAAAAADGAAARAAGAHEHEERRQSSEARRAAAARAVVLGAAGGGGAYDGGGGSGGVGALFASMDEREAERDHARADDDSELLWPLSAKLVPLFTLATAHELTSGAQARASISFAPDGQSVATAVGMTLRVWHLAAGAAVELRKELQLAALGAVATYAPDGYELAIGDSSGGLRLCARCERARSRRICARAPCRARRICARAPCFYEFLFLSPFLISSLAHRSSPLRRMRALLRRAQAVDRTFAGRDCDALRPRAARHPHGRFRGAEQGARHMSRCVPGGTGGTGPGPRRPRARRSGPGGGRAGL